MVKRKKRTCDYCGVDISHRRANAKFCKDSHKVLHHQYGPKKNHKPHQQQLTVDPPRPKPTPRHGRGNDYQIASPAQLVKSLESDLKHHTGTIYEVLDEFKDRLDSLEARRRPPGPIGQYVLDVVDDLGSISQGAKVLDMPKGTLYGWVTGQRPIPEWLEEEHWLEGWICEGYGPCPGRDCGLQQECNRER